MAWSTEVPPPPERPAVTGWFAIFNLLSAQTMSMATLGKVIGMMAALQVTPLTNAAAVKGLQDGRQYVSLVQSGQAVGKPTTAQSFAITNSALLRAIPALVQPLSLLNMATVVGVATAPQQTPITNAGLAKGLQSAIQSMAMTDAAINKGAPTGPNSFGMSESATVLGTPGANDSFTVATSGAAIAVVLSPQQFSLLNAGVVTGGDFPLSAPQAVTIVDAATAKGIQAAAQSYTVVSGASLVGNQAGAQLVAITDSGATKGVQAASTSFTITNSGAVYATILAPQSMSLSSSATVYQASTGVTFNAVTSTTLNWANAISVNHTAPAGAMVVVDVISSSGSFTPTYGGVAMTPVASVGWTKRYKIIDATGGTKAAAAALGDYGGSGIVVRSYLNAADIVYNVQAGAGQAISQSVVLDAGEVASAIFGAKNGSASTAYFTGPTGGTVNANFQDGNRTGMCAMDSDVSTTFALTGNPSYYNGWDSIVSIIKPNAPTAVLFDAAGAGTNGTASSGTASHTAKLGSTVLIAVSALTGTVTGVTFAGVTATLLRAASTTLNQAIYAAQNVPGGAQNAVATFSGNTQYSISTVSYLNVVDMYAFNPVTGTGPPMSAAWTIGANEMVVNVWSLRSGDLLSQSGGNLRTENQQNFATTSISDANTSTTFSADPVNNVAWIATGIVLAVTTKVIQFVGYAYGAGAAPTLASGLGVGMTCQVGDLLIAATSKATTGMPTPPAGWTALAGGVSAAGYSSNAAYKFATDPTDPAASWGNSPTAIGVFVYRFVSAIGAQSTAGNTASVNTVNFPALTMQAPGTAWVANLVARISALSAGRAGYTRRLNGFSIEDWDSAAPVASSPVASGNVTESNSSPWRIWAVELKR